MMRKWMWTLGCTAIMALLAPAGAARAAWTPDGIDLTRPRLLLRPGDLPVIHDRLAREPYRTLLERIVSQANSADGWDLDDDSIPAAREKSKAAKNWAFLYAIDRSVAGGVVVPFATPEARAAAGDRARDYLLAMYTVSRIADTFDDDINTSEEIVSYATAYDTLVGAGYPLSPEDDATIRANLIALTADLYEDYLGLDPRVGTQVVFLTNNHRTKSGAALAVAGIALAEHVPDPVADPLGLTEPANWVEYGLAQVDRVLRYGYLSGDGAYSEGPYYARYSGQNHLPLLFAVDRLVGGAEGPVFGLPQPNLWRHPLFARHQSWMLDMTLPDGSMAHIDDGTVARSYYYGMLSSFAEAPAYRWAWEFGVQPIVSEGSIDLAPDQIVAFDDSIAAALPEGSPTSFYVEGGNAIFRADWSRDAVMAVALGEHGIANEFARDEQGRGIPAAASHEQADPGAYQLWAFGEQMAIDPGYFTFETRSVVAQPRHHNVVLVDGRGPSDPFTATLRWQDRDAEPPTDGQSTITHTLDSGFVDAATVHSSYGGTLPGTTGSTPRALFERRFVFAGDAYLLLADYLSSARARTYQWLLHGNGGPGSDGLFEATPFGGVWTLRGARLSGAIGFDGGAPAFSTGTEVHEIANREERSHTVLRATANAERVRALTLLLPTRSANAPPVIEPLTVDDGAGFRFTDAAADRVAIALHRTPGLGEIAIDAAASDGSVWNFDARGDGSLRHGFADDAKVLRWNGATLVESGSHGRLAIRPEAARAEVVAESADPQVRVGGLAFAAQRADGACAIAATADGSVVSLGRSRVFTLHADAGNSAPAADAGASPRRADVDTAIALDGGASCDLDGDPLTPRWQLISAPGGSAWSLEGADRWTPTLRIDRRGPYRIRLIVTDAHGAVSRPADVVVFGGTSCTDRFDQDRDGLIDNLDPQCPSPGEGAGAACGLLGPELLCLLLIPSLRRQLGAGPRV